MQARQVVAFDCGDPRGQALVVAAGHLGEGGDVADGSVQLRAAGLDLCQLGCLVLGEVAWGGGAGELADGVPRQAQHLGDLGVVPALREQVMDHGVAFPAADRQAALGTVRARSVGGHVGGDAAAWPAGLPIAGFRGGIR
jgi:hypothetical protein